MMTCIGKAKKFNGVWILKPFGVRNFPIRGKHLATICVEKRKNENVYLCLAFGDVFIETPNEITYEI